MWLPIGAILLAALQAPTPRAARPTLTFFSARRCAIPLVKVPGLGARFPDRMAFPAPSWLDPHIFVAPPAPSCDDVR